MLRTDAATVPPLGACLLIAALPFGVLFLFGFTTSVMGQSADPRGGQSRRNSDIQHANVEKCSCHRT